MSSIVDLFTSESQIPIKFGDFYRLTRAAAERDLIMNAVNCNVPHRYIRETVTGEPETEGKEDQHEQDENRMD
jgi:hypothetical protein